MKRKQIDEDWPILEFYFDRVVRNMERPQIGTPRKVSRRAVLEMYRENRNMRQTARALNVSPALIHHIVFVAFATAKRLAGIWPPVGGGRRQRR
jgi:hypothetical protein